MPEPRNSGGRLEVLQVYRGIAASLVVLYHVSLHCEQFFETPFLNGAFRFGDAGVDFFFVISGFIISFITMPRFGDRAYLPKYLKKRIVRIYPIFWTILLLTILSSLAFQRNPELILVPEKIISAIFLYNQLNNPIVGVSWTLSYEVLFYAVFAALILFPRKIALALLVLWAAIIILNQIHPLFPDLMVTSRYFLEFLAGCLAAYLAHHLNIPDLARIRAVLMCLFIGIGIYLGSSGQAAGENYFFVLGPIIFFLVLLAGSSRDVSVLPGKRVLVLIGDASYSIYLTHYLFTQGVYSLLRRLDLFGFLNPFWFNVILLCLLIAGGCVFYLLVEKPLLAYCQKLTGLTPA